MSINYNPDLINDYNFFILSHSIFSNNLDCLNLLLKNNETKEFSKLLEDFLPTVEEYTDNITKTGIHYNSYPVCLFFKHNIDLKQIVHNQLLESLQDYSWISSYFKNFINNPKNNLDRNTIALIGPGNNFCGNYSEGLFLKPYLKYSCNSNYAILYFKYIYLSK